MGPFSLCPEAGPQTGLQGWDKDPSEVSTSWMSQGWGGGGWGRNKEMGCGPEQPGGKLGAMAIEDLGRLISLGS